MDDLLAPVGLDADHSAVYLHLLDHPGVTVADIAAALGTPEQRLRGVLRPLVRLRLIDRVPGTGGRYIAAAPDVAIDAVVLRKRQALDELCATARDLARRRHADSVSAPADTVELVRGETQVLNTLADLELAARDEVLIVDCPPYMTGIVMNTNELQALERGVRYRAIYHAPTLHDPHKRAHLRRYLDAGEQARSLPRATTKMVVVDRSAALIPTSFTTDRVGERLLVRNPALVEALATTFEHLWDQATPLGAAPQDLAIDDKHCDVLRLMASGAKDQAIARALGVTTRTVVRRISELMKLLNADTRFQAGVQAAARGLL